MEIPKQSRVDALDRSSKFTVKDIKEMLVHLQKPLTESDATVLNKFIKIVLSVQALYQYFEQFFKRWASM